MKKETLHIDLVYDIICPWCYIGHQRLRNAIKKTNAKVQINLIPYRIRPNIPNKGLSIQEYWMSKGITDIQAAYKNVKKAAESEGLGLYPEKFSSIPNTLKLHKVILKAEEKELGLDVLHAIQSAYFTDGIALTSLDTIIDITEDFLSESEVREAWEDLDYFETLVLSKEQKAKELHINSVPTYLIDEKHRIKGAVSNFTLVDMLNQLAPKEFVGEFCDVSTGLC